MFFCSTFTSSFAQKTDKHLQKKISDLLQGFNGDAGVFVYDISGNKIAAVNADTIFPTASMVKVPILIGLMHKIHNGEFCVSPGYALY